MVGEWVAGCFALPPTPPTTNTSLLSDVRQRTNLASRANTMVQINAYNTTHQHQHQYASVRTLQNTTLEDFLRRETNTATEDHIHTLHILTRRGCKIRCTLYQLLIKNNIQCNTLILIAVVVYIYFERSEFLIDTSPKKNPSACARVPVCRVHVSNNLGFSVEKLSWF